MRYSFKVILLIVLIVLAVLFLGGGYGMRSHPTYRSYSTGGMGLGGILLVVVILLFLTGNLRLN